MTAPKLAIFDMDGTLVDSQAHIHAAMTAAFAHAGREPLPRREVLGVVGLSLPDAIARLAPDLSPAALAEMVAVYKDTYAGIARMDGAAASPLFDGALGVLEALRARADLILGIATGKSRRGLAHVLEMHGLDRLFATTQVADDHPSKPDPSMLRAALAATGCTASDAVMIGDTVFDVEMGRAAGIATLAVGWGYHAPEMLRQAGPDAMIDTVGDLEDAILRLMGLAP